METNEFPEPNAECLSTSPLNCSHGKFERGKVCGYVAITPDAHIPRALLDYFISLHNFDGRPLHSLVEEESYMVDVNMSIYYRY